MWLSGADGRPPKVVGPAYQGGPRQAQDAFDSGLVDGYRRVRSTGRRQAGGHGLTIPPPYRDGRRPGRCLLEDERRR